LQIRKSKADTSVPSLWKKLRSRVLVRGNVKIFKHNILLVLLISDNLITMHELWHKIFPLAESSLPMKKSSVGITIFQETDG